MTCKPVSGWPEICRLASACSNAQVVVRDIRAGRQKGNYQVLKSGRNNWKATYLGSEFEALAWRQCLVIRHFVYSICVAKRDNLSEVIRQLTNQVELNRTKGQITFASAFLDKSIPKILPPTGKPNGLFDFEFYLGFGRALRVEVTFPALLAG